MLAFQETYTKLETAYFALWQPLLSEVQLRQSYSLIKKLAPLNDALAHLRLMRSVDPLAFKTYYVKKAHFLAECLRRYIELN